MTSEPAETSELYALAQRVGQRLLAAGRRLATAESCTGGWIAKTLTDVAGSSDWFERGFVTYSNAAKQAMVGVTAATLERDGAVSRAAVREMALGALERSEADLAVAVSGIAGPGGAAPGKPVGTVWFAWAARRPEGSAVRDQHCVLQGDREAVRRQSVVIALEGVLRALDPAGGAQS